MIIGKSLTALGGGGLKPEIIVTAKAGALLNLHYKDSSIILQTYQLGESETQHTFVVSVSETAYMVEDATNSFSVEVLVDAVSQYSVDIQYVLWLYKDGVSHNFENFHIFGVPTAYGHNFSVAGKITTQKIDLSEYSKICWESSITSYRGVVYFLSDVNIDNAFNSQVYMGSANQTNGETSLEGINDTVYVAVGNHQGWSGDDMSVSDYDTYYSVINATNASYSSYYSRVWLE